MGSPVLPKTKESQRWLATAYVGLGPPGTKKPLLYRAINFPINYNAKAVLGYDLGGSRLCQGCAKDFRPIILNAIRSTVSV